MPADEARANAVLPEKMQSEKERHCGPNGVFVKRPNIF